ncbi:hypothetical protein LTR08_006067 [Meristemomyces frigidus]|nr:hypothetical protein LTR08_006067 [Meristemomyces frigidus]
MFLFTVCILAGAGVYNLKAGTRHFVCGHDTASGPSCAARFAGPGAELYREDSSVPAWVGDHCQWEETKGWVCGGDIGERRDGDDELPAGVWVEECDDGEEGCERVGSGR